MEGHYQIGDNKYKKPWKKNLYDNVEYPDNYTDETFLIELKKNIEIKPLTLWQCIKGTTVVIEEICVVILFVLIFVYLHNQWFDPKIVFVNTSCLTLLGFVYYRLCFWKKLHTTVREEIKTLLIFLVFGYIFSPVLHTLTDTISTDTIYTMTFLMMCTHLIFFDYGLSTAIVSNSLSLNAAIFGSICLASRLASPYHAFVLMAVSVECFVFFPVLSSQLNSNFYALFSIMTVALYLLYQISVSMTILFCFLVFFINVICPFLFLRWHKYKENIYGPWDEAIVKDLDCLTKF